MRYKNELFQLGIKFQDDVDMLEYVRKNRNPNATLDDIIVMSGAENEEKLHELNKTIIWMDWYNSKNYRYCPENIAKPTNESMLKVVDIMLEKGNRTMKLSEDYKTGNNIDLYKSLKKMGKKNIECAVYYKELIDSGFYDKVDWKDSKIN